METTPTPFSEKERNALPLIRYELERRIVPQRLRDGYVNATALCQAAQKSFGRYHRNKTTQNYIEALSKRLEIPKTDLVQMIRKNEDGLRGTWVHPQVAFHLAQWLSPDFAVQVSLWISEWMTKKLASDSIRYHLRRYIANASRVPAGHFSILAEMMTLLVAPLEHLGYSLPEHLIPDASAGLLFNAFLRENGYDPAAMPLYPHEYEDGRIIEARAYPEDVLPLFRRHFRDEWLRKHAQRYFARRAPDALPYLEQVLALADPQKNRLSPKEETAFL